MIVKDNNKQQFVKVIGDHANVYIVEDVNGNRYTARANHCSATILSEIPILPIPKPVIEAPKPKVEPNPFRRDLLRGEEIKPPIKASIAKPGKLF